MSCNSKTAGRRVKQVEASHLEETCSIYMGSVDLVVFKVILGHSVHLLGIKEQMCKLQVHV